VAAVWSYLHRGDDVLAGVAIGLLAFRPQYCLPLLGLVFLSRHWRTVGTATGVIVATWIVNAVVAGGGWISWWLEAVVPFVETDAEVNAHNSISLPGFIHALVGSSTAATQIGYGFAVVVVGALCWLWTRADAPLELKIAGAAAGILLMSPHTMFYDTGLLIVAFGGIAAAVDDRRLLVPGAAAMWIGSWIHLGAKAWGFTPLVLVPIVLFAITFALVATSVATREGELAHA